MEVYQTTARTKTPPEWRRSHHDPRGDLTMAKQSGWWIICPFCDHRGLMDEFEPSLADEYFCPKCRERFEVDLSYDEVVDPDEEQEFLANENL